MAVWAFIVIVGWATFHFGRWIATWFRVPVPGPSTALLPARKAPLSLGIIVVALGFFAWNRSARLYPFTMLHASVLAGCTIFGYQSVQARRKSLTDEINRLAEGVARVFARPKTSENLLKALVALATQNDVIFSKLTIGIYVNGPDGRPVGSVKASGGTLVDDPQFGKVQPTSLQNKVDILLQEIGFALLAKSGEDVIPKGARHALSARELKALRESSERTRAHLDAAFIDWANVNEAVYHISEARLRRGILLEELTLMEQRIRSQRAKH